MTTYVFLKYIFLVSLTLFPADTFSFCSIRCMWYNTHHAISQTTYVLGCMWYNTHHAISQTRPISQHQWVDRFLSGIFPIKYFFRFILFPKNVHVLPNN